MTPSLLLTALPPTSDTYPPNADCIKRHVVLPSHPAGTRPGPSSTSTTPTSTGIELERDAYDASINETTSHTLVVRQWTGTPIRAIVPLPRRKLAPIPSPSPSRSVSVHVHVHVHTDCPLNVPPSTVLGPSPSRCLTRPAHVWDDTGTDTDSGTENEEEEKDEGHGWSDDSDCDAATATASRCCSYESITAVEGLSAWSFEELRVECYAQSLVARGTKPPPVVQPALAIPPAFVPRSVVKLGVHSQQ